MTVRVPRLPFSVDPLIAEAKRRARQRRLLVLGVVLLAAVVAGLTLGLPGGSGGGRGSAASNSGSLSGSRASANQARLERGGPVKLLSGHVSTDVLGMKASFEVSPHWYGEQKPGLLRLARQLAAGGYEVGLSRGGIEVQTLDSPLAQSVRRLQTAADIRVHHVSSIRIGGHPGRRYSLSSNHLFELRPGNNLGGTGEEDVILLGVRHGTLVIKNIDAVVPKLIPDHDQERREAELLIQSFRFHS